jgi:hypothetical protein
MWGQYPMFFFGFLAGTELMYECVEYFAVHIVPGRLNVDGYNIGCIDRVKSFCGVMSISVCKTRVVLEFLLSVPFFDPRRLEELWSVGLETGQSVNVVDG